MLLYSSLASCPTLWVWPVTAPAGYFLTTKMNAAFVPTQHDLSYFLMPLSRKIACIHYKYLKLEPTVTGSCGTAQAGKKLVLTQWYLGRQWHSQNLSVIRADESLSHLSFLNLSTLILTLCRVVLCPGLPKLWQFLHMKKVLIAGLKKWEQRHSGLYLESLSAGCTSVLPTLMLQNMLQGGIKLWLLAFWRHQKAIGAVIWLCPEGILRVGKIHVQPLWLSEHPPDATRAQLWLHSEG